ncbi:MAG TPA: hypothetical protein VL400_27295 [Polyangiaceae bacterium]|nr:hypothetical protein [Polyangiaceae bacterium]
MRIVVDANGWELVDDERDASTPRAAASGATPTRAAAAKTVTPGSGVYAKLPRSASDRVEALGGGPTDPAPPLAGADAAADEDSIPPPASVPRDIAAWADESDDVERRAGDAGGKHRVA